MHRSIEMKQSIKSQETKSRIFEAAKQILQENGYEALSIKHICEQAAVSNGSFYHHFKSKEDLLSYYIEEQPSVTQHLVELHTVEDLIRNIARVYIHYASYCMELGVAFISAYYNPKNQALNHDNRTLRAYPIITAEKLIEEAMAREIVWLQEPLQSVITDLRMIVIGNVFEWCVTEGNADLQANMQRSIRLYLSAVCRPFTS